MEIALNAIKIRITKLKVSYVLVISFFVFYLVRDMQYNTAFVDEAIYATIGEGVLRKIYWENALSWMGGSYIYPVISGSINRYYGLEGIRIFSTLCVLVTGIISAKIAQQLGGKYSALTALTFFLFSSVTLNMGQLGTYDSPSLVFTSLSFYIALSSRYQTGFRKYLLIIFSSVFMSFAVLSKYVAILFAPTILLVLLPFTIKFKEIVKSLFKTFFGFLVWSIPFTAILGWYVYSNYAPVMNFFKGDFFSEPSSIFIIIEAFVKSTNIVMIGAIMSAIYAVFKVKGEKKWLILILFMGGFAPIVYHITSMNIRSFPKHLVFTLYFWAPLCGWMMNKIYSKLTRVSRNFTFINNSFQLIWTATFILILTNFWLSFARHWQFQRSWPSSTNTLEYLRKNKDKDDKVFAEGAAVYKFHLFEGFDDPSAWPSTWYLDYNGQQGADAMKSAIMAKEFDYIILNDYFTSQINREIKPVINEYYEVVNSDDYKLSGVHNATTVIWKPKVDKEKLALNKETDWFGKFIKY